MISAELESIKVSYEELGMSPSEIAADRELDEIAVKAALMQCSSLYRQACGQGRLDFSDSDLEEANEVIRNLALYGEDEHIRLKAAMYMRDDKKGRKDIIKAMGGSQFNVLMFNEQISKIRQIADRAKSKLGRDKVVEVEG